MSGAVQQKSLAPFPLQSSGGMDQTLVHWWTQSLTPRVNNSLQSVSLTGDITGDGADTIVTTITPKAVTLGKMADLPTHTIIGNAADADGAPQALTGAQATALLVLFNDLLKGLVPASGGGILNYLRADGSWAVPPAAGPAGGDLAGTYPNPTVAGLKGSAVPALAAGYLNWTGAAWTFTATPYTLPTATPTTLGGVKPDGTSILNSAGVLSATPASIGALASGGTAVNATNLVGATQTAMITWSVSTGQVAAFTSNGNTFINLSNSAAGGRSYRIYSADAGNNGFSGFGVYDATGGFYAFKFDTSGNLTPNGNLALLTGKVVQVNGVQVLSAPVAGMGATLSAYTLTGTYATDLAKLQALYNQMIALVAALKTHGMVAT